MAHNSFYIKTSIANGGTNDAYNTGVTNNGGAGGTEIVFTVPHDAPEPCTTNAVRISIWQGS